MQSKLDTGLNHDSMQVYWNPDVKTAALAIMASRYGVEYL